MSAFLNRHADKCYAILRIIAGCLFACHGAQKLFAVLGGQSEVHDPESLVAGLVEFIGGVLIALGLFTRVAAFTASGEMAIAYLRRTRVGTFGPFLTTGSWPFYTALSSSTSAFAELGFGASTPSCCGHERDLTRRCSETANRPVCLVFVQPKIISNLRGR